MIIVNLFDENNNFITSTRLVHDDALKRLIDGLETTKVKYVSHTDRSITLSIDGLSDVKSIIVSMLNTFEHSLILKKYKPSYDKNIDKEEIKKEEDKEIKKETTAEEENKTKPNKVKIGDVEGDLIYILYQLKEDDGLWHDYITAVAQDLTSAYDYIHNEMNGKCKETYIMGDVQYMVFDEYNRVKISVLDFV